MFERFEEELPKIVRYYCRKYGVRDSQEVESMAVALFVPAYNQFDPDRNDDIVGFIKDRVFKGLVTVARIEAKRRKKLARLSGETNTAALDEATAPEPIPEFSVKKFAAMAEPFRRKDIRTVLNALFDGDFLSLPSPTKCRVALSNYLKTECGWTRRRLEATYDQIRKILEL